MTESNVTPDGLGTVSVTLTPKKPLRKLALRCFLSFAIDNAPPEISSLAIVSGDNLRNNTAFNENTEIKAEFRFTMTPNSDEIETKFVWSQKKTMV